MKVIVNFILWIFVVLLLGADCKKEVIQQAEFPAGDFIKSGDYLGDYFPTNGWRECNPGEVGMDVEVLKNLNDEIAGLVENDYEIHSVLIIRNGYIVAEQYYSKYFDKDIEHMIH